MKPENQRADTCTICGGPFVTDRDGLWSGDQREHRQIGECFAYAQKQLAAIQTKAAEAEGIADAAEALADAYSRDIIRLTDDLNAERAQHAKTQQERDALLACRHGDQRCFECPDTQCCDNANEAAKEAQAAATGQGIHANRLNEHHPREVAFAAAWEQEQRDCDVLQLLCSPECDGHDAGAVRVLDPICRYRRFPLGTITARDRTIAATVIQWLGSNVGQSFLREALRQCGYDIVRRERQPEQR